VSIRADARYIETSPGQRSHWTVCFTESVSPFPELTIFSQEMLNKHRAESLFTTHNIVQVPLPLQETCLRGGQLALSYAVNTSTLPAFHSYSTGSCLIPCTSSCSCTSREYLQKYSKPPSRTIFQAGGSGDCRPCHLQDHCRKFLRCSFLSQQYLAPTRPF